MTDHNSPSIPQGRADPNAGSARPDPAQVLREFHISRPDDRLVGGRRALIWLGVVAILAVLMFTGFVRLTGGARLAESAMTGLALEAGVGEPVTVAVGAFDVDGADRLRLTGASLLEPPDGLLGEVRVALDDGSGRIATVVGDLDPLRYTLRSVNGVVLEPGDNPSLYPVLTLRSDRPGTFELADVVIRYEADRSARAALFRLEGTFTVR